VVFSRPDPDRLALLEEQRRFLLRSIVDLDREHAAGDMDDADYRELREDYTARAAATIRAIDSGRDAFSTRSEVGWWRRLAIVVAVVVMITVVWWLLSVSSAQRLPGQQISGLDPRDRTQLLLSQARATPIDESATAAELYAEVLADDPDNAEALTYRGWRLALSTRVRPDAMVEPVLQEAVASLIAGIEADRTYPDPYCFLGIVQYSFLGNAEIALPFVEGCLEADPPADVRSLVASLRDEVVEAVGALESGGE
jgi:hypothetical protein